MVYQITEIVAFEESGGMAELTVLGKFPGVTSFGYGVGGGGLADTQFNSWTLELTNDQFELLRRDGVVELGPLQRNEDCFSIEALQAGTWFLPAQVAGLFFKKEETEP